MKPKRCLYKKWFKKQLYNFIPFKKPNRFQFDILRFLAENGSRSVYDLALGPPVHKERKRGRPPSSKYHRPKIPKRDEELSLGPTRQYILEISAELENYGLIRRAEDLSGPHPKKILHITFQGMIVFLTAWETQDALKQMIGAIIERYPNLFLFSKQWKAIKNIAGEDVAFEALIETANTFRLGKCVEVKIDHLGMRFKTFFHSYVGRMLIRGTLVIEQKNKSREEPLSQWLKKHEELRNAYISYLAVQDIYDLDRGPLEINNPYEFRSEGELAFFEDRKIEENPLFLNRLREFFPKYAPVKYMFTGLFLTKLLWKPIKREPTGFHVSLA